MLFSLLIFSGVGAAFSDRVRRPRLAIAAVIMVLMHTAIGDMVRASGDRIGAKIDAAPESIVYQANTPYLLDAFEMGARGTMAITSTAAADILVALWDAVSEQTEDAEVHHQQLVFLDALLRFGHPASAKCLAQLRGLPFELTCRAPCVLQPEGAKAMSVWWEAYQAGNPELVI